MVVPGVDVPIGVMCDGAVEGGDVIEETALEVTAGDFVSRGADEVEVLVVRLGLVVDVVCCGVDLGIPLCKAREPRAAWVKATEERPWMCEVVVEGVTVVRRLGVVR